MNGKVLEGKSREELLDLARAYKWWHSIDLGGMVTSGVTGRSPLTERAFDQVDFAGKKVLDIGCWDGLWSFEAEKRGASAVHSVDYVSLRSWSEQPTYQLAHKLLGSKARYYPNLSVYDIGRLGVTDFDIVVYCGIYYHLLEPLRAFAALRDVMKEGGHMIVEGPVLVGTERVFADFYGRTWFAEDPTNWWLPSMPCLREWLDCTFFDVVNEFSSKRGFAPPAAGPEPASTRSPVHRLRSLLTTAAVPQAGSPEAGSQDRVSVIARATSVSERLAHHMTEVQALPPLVTTPGVTRESIAGFCEAAARFYDAQPWLGVRRGVTIKVEPAALGGQPAFVMVLGDGSLQRGMAIYFDRGWLTMTLQGSLPGNTITWAAFLAVLYRGAAQMPMGEASTLRDEGWTASEDIYPFAVFNEGQAEKTRKRGSVLRRPKPEELQLLEGCLRALPGFIESHGTNQSAVEDVSVPVTTGEIRLTLSWMPEGEREL